MGCTMTLIELPPRNWGMHLLSNVSANAFKHTVIGMRIIVVVVVVVDSLTTGPVWGHMLSHE
jgi:hypothetical protein